MTFRNFQFAMSAADEHGNIDVQEIAAVSYVASNEDVHQIKLDDFDKRQQVMAILLIESTFVIYWDKFGNGYTRMIF